jgi:hypothetical protein
MEEEELPYGAMNPTLVVLAAGLSTRYGRLKQLEPLGPGGEALLDYSVFDALRAGISRVVLVIREELEEAFEVHLRGRWPQEVEVAFHHQRLEDLPGLEGGLDGVDEAHRLLAARVKPWGTAHALLTARDDLPGPFVVLNADDYYGPSAFSRAVSLMKAQAEAKPGDAAVFGLVTYTLRDTLSPHGGVSRGLCEVDPRGWLVGIREVLGVREGKDGLVGKTLDGEELILSGREPASTNCWVFTPDVFPHLREGFRDFLEGAGNAPGTEPEFLIPTEVNRLLLSGGARVRVAGASDPFLGITHPQDREWVVEGLAERVREGKYPSPLWGR